MAQALLSTSISVATLSSLSSLSSASAFRSSRGVALVARSGDASRMVSVKAIFGTKSGAKKTVTKAKPVRKNKVESGVFGTSTGFGFTKENELLVGRLAMLGFAASLLGEIITGDGILGQLGLETGVPLNEIDPLVGFFVGFNVFGAIGALGDRGRFVDEPAKDETKEGVRSILGLAEDGKPLFGFTKANELFVGRLAQLGFSASILGEVITGKGALGQLGVETGIPLNEVDPLVGFFIAFFVLAGISPTTGKFLNDEDED